MIKEPNILDQDRNPKVALFPSDRGDLEFACR